ncbi:MAG: YaaC family protein [bacterium]|nr:YaaC family protein [bacterium]
MQKATVVIQMDELWGKLLEKIKSYNLGNLEEEVVLNIHQAQEYHSALENTTSLTSPLILFYYMVSLVRIIFICKKKLPFKEVLHGLTTRKEGTSVTVKAHGTFPIIHSIISKTKIKPGTKFCLEELVNMIPWITEIEDPPLPPISTSYLLCFLLSMLSRYEPVVWDKIRKEFSIELFLRETSSYFLEEVIKVL